MSFLVGISDGIAQWDNGGESAEVAICATEADAKALSHLIERWIDEYRAGKQTDWPIAGTNYIAIPDAAWSMNAYTYIRDIPDWKPA